MFYINPAKMSFLFAKIKLMKKIRLITALGLFKPLIGNKVDDLFNFKRLNCYCC